MMGSGAGLHADQAGPQRGEELQHLAALRLSANDNFPGFTNGVDLEHRLRDVQSNREDTATWHIAMPAEEPFTASMADTAMPPGR